MANEIRLKTPLSNDDVDKLKIGDKVLITGVIYTGRDAAHKRLTDLIKEGKELPIDVKGQIIYYVGPAPARPGNPIGSAGPTTSYRMDAYAPKLMELGMKGMIGKGNRPARSWQEASRRQQSSPMRTWDRRPSIVWRSRIFRRWSSMTPRETTFTWRVRRNTGKTDHNTR